jgi:DNA-binding MarR family transcriptional regulator
VPKKFPIQTLLDRIKANWPDAASPETDIIFSVIRFHEMIRAHTEKALKPFDLTHSAFEVLVALRAQPLPRQLTPTELGQSTLLSSGGTANILNDLERRDLIQRVTNPDDGRSKIVQLTHVGERLSEQVMESVMKHDKLHFEGFSDEDAVITHRDAIVELLRVIESQ